MVKLDLPLPDTPVTQVKVPSGIEALTFCRLFSFAPFTVSARLRSIGRRLVGTSIWRKPSTFIATSLPE